MLGERPAPAARSGPPSNSQRRPRDPRHVGIVCHVLTRVASGVGNVIGVAIRLGHGEIVRSGPKPIVETATPIRGIQGVGLRR
jgi:hypothetical protein